MIQGTFDVAIDTPKHHKRGILSLESAGGAITMKLSIHGLEPLEFVGTCIDADFAFEGSGDFPGLGSIDYRANGNVWGNSVTVNCESSAGRIEVFGTRLSASAGGATSSHDYLMAASTGEFGRNDGMMYSGLYADGG